MIKLDKSDVGQIYSTLNEHRKFIHQIAMPDLVKKDLLKDIDQIKIVLGKAERSVDGSA
jgi:hypothetical protein